MKIVIIGGVAGGMSAATRLRRLNEQAEIIVLEKGPYVSFANCGLPYYVAGEIENRSDLLVQTPEQLKARFRLDVRPNSEAIKIDTEGKEIMVASESDTYTLAYDKLILSPGAKPFIPPIKGLEMAKNSFTLRNVPDVDEVMTYIESHNPKKAVIIGAGFIGLEMAESLVNRGIHVTIVEKAPHVLPTIDEEMAAFITKELSKNQINVITGTSVIGIENEGRSVIIENGAKIETDFILLSVGVQPESRLAVDSGIQTGLRGGIVVDDNYQTSAKDVYAVGDAILVKQYSTQKDTLISLASPANRQGRQVADILSGLKRKNLGSLGTAIVRVFDQTIASTGLTEQQLKSEEKNYQVVHIQGKNHAGYYPNASMILLKLLFNPISGEIYGAQAVGKEGVDKRIDILATAIKGNLTVEDLPELEFTYAPPFGSAKDPVNMAGYAALNSMEGITESIQWYELQSYLKKGALLLDVRGEKEIATNGYFPNALTIPLDSLRERMHELPQDKEFIVSCQSGLRSYIAERILKQNGFRVKNLDGAFSLYSTVRPEEVK
ncbi:FAD-dependent oxidoreductase [Carnobacterium maltaromaticum]|jgi:NADPH-dependent 2,4-dienoyl-CoA reductase/sulfur reductase-like enzyme/rhodanese-related sulfurtransferase|uniref:Pyridine nucleotide-disulphide oxidoreductase family protein n=1 Tax=Carnobacterium maltaromaticum LMA28 TaxID=1234679 RepID=K8EHX6_CARML|nr:FAD-dependent oxidoreductase [Carnobacterium maltaromaticum]KRN65691.1 coenzyme A disulfide reductase [Carnobacterium maltaromaticum DSM 20342]MCI1818806.1 FAD-dependent oxidoreductase [Carnobacterium maltaromaticum]CCO11413.2 pyridine nucleotide-disulphide oxidoreductase family protein [Carnobacterium maltaromaticum LMA28]